MNFISNTWLHIRDATSEYWLGWVGRHFVSFCVLVLTLSIFVSIPFPFIYIAQTKFVNATVQNSQGQPLTQIRFGIWSACIYDSQNHHRTCLKSTYDSAYNVTLTTTENKTNTAVVQPSWTRGLVAHPIAAFFTFIASVLLFMSGSVMTLKTIAISLLAASFHAIGFGIDIALFLAVKHEMASLGEGVATKPGPGFWLMIPILILAILVGREVYIHNPWARYQLTRISLRQNFWNNRQPPTPLRNRPTV